MLVNYNRTVTIAINIATVVDEASRVRKRKRMILVLFWFVLEAPFSIDIIKHLQQLTFGPLGCLEENGYPKS